ncbi:MAG TPA: amidohydrolase family protein [Burkholderiales bacterium]
MSESRPRLSAPANSCDTHMHIYDARFPQAPDGPKPPGEFTVEGYRKLQARIGVSRVIVVQANAYQDDNRCTLDAIAQLGAGARGVGVVKPEASSEHIAELTRGGIRGIRFMMLPGGALAWDVMDELAARVHDFGWHAVVQLDGRTLPEREAQIRRLPGRFIIDHVGKFLEPVRPSHPAFKSLLKLVDTGRCWVKLSAPYEVSKNGPPRYQDVGALARALAKHAPERMLWASNWPHPSAPKDAMPDDANLLDLLLEWAPDEGARCRILVDNPADLYGF